jgi:hypothetical protein
MLLGLRLSSTPRDRAALVALVEQVPDALLAEWSVWELPAGQGRPLVVASDVLTPDHGAALAVRGVDVVFVEHLGSGALLLRDLELDRGRAEHSPTAAARRVPGLLAAFPPIAAHPPGPPAEVLFVVEDASATARLLERLVLLERADARLCRLSLTDDVENPVTAVRVMNPPLWLVLTYAEQDAGVRVLSRAGDDDVAGLFVEYGFVVLLADLVDTALRARGEVGLWFATGQRFVRARALWPERPVHDVLRAELPASTATATAVPLVTTFPVTLRFGPALPADESAEPELFVLDDEQVARLERFVEAAAPEELDRLLLTRVDDGSGRALVVLRELVRPGVSRLGARLQSALLARGFVRAAGHDGLFVPPGRRLLPALRREDLRTLLALQDAAAVLIDEDADGLRIVRVRTLTDEPIAKLVRYIATSRRQELDRIHEDAVLTFPGLMALRPHVATPATAQQRVGASFDAQRSEGPRPAPAAVPPVPAPSSSGPTESGALDRAAWKRRAAKLEGLLVAGSDDVEPWRALAELKLALHDPTDAAACAGVASFLEESVRVPSTLLRATAPQQALEQLIQVATLSPTEAEGLSALALAAVAKDDLPGELTCRVVEVVSRADFPASRRLQWATLRAIHKRTGDLLGLTRAKERVLGALNAHGLRPAIDAPRFVRLAHAVDRAAGPDGGSIAPVSVVQALAAAQEAEQQRTGGRDLVLRAILAHGVARAGSDVTGVLAELARRAAQRGGPLVAIVELYAARLRLGRGDPRGDREQVWAAELERTTRTVARDEDRRVVAWLVKRSSWLRPSPPPPAPQGLRPALQRIVAAAVDHRDTADLHDAAERAVAVRGCFDYEIASVLERLMGLALEQGRDDVIVDVAHVAHRTVAGIRILAHRAQVLGLVVRAAATAGQPVIVARCLDDIAALAHSREAPSTRDLLLALRPALEALRRLGEASAARRCLDAFVPLTDQTIERETGPLAAVLAEGYRSLGIDEQADAMLRRAWGRIVMPTSGHVDRFEAGCAVVEALAHWPHEERADRCRDLLHHLEIFQDTFTTRMWFAAHQVLLAERVVDCLVDEKTESHDRLQRWLDDDEARLRRRILADWRAARGP